MYSYFFFTSSLIVTIRRKGKEGKGGRKDEAYIGNGACVLYPYLRIFISIYDEEIDEYLKTTEEVEEEEGEGNGGREEGREEWLRLMYEV